MTTVERVKSICAERHIPIARVEHDLGFSNGYIASLRKGSFPADRLLLVADYLGLSMRYLITGQEKTAPALTGTEEQLLSMFRDLRIDQQETVMALVNFLYSQKNHTDIVNEVTG